MVFVLFWCFYFMRWYVVKYWKKKDIEKLVFICSVYNYVDLEEIKEDLKNFKKCLMWKLRKVRDKFKNL